MVDGHHTNLHTLHSHTTFVTPQLQLVSIGQIKKKSKKQAKFCNKE